MTSDFTSKYAFALADSDSDSDDDGVNQFLQKTKPVAKVEPPAAEEQTMDYFAEKTAESQQTGTASGLFGDDSSQFQEPQIPARHEEFYSQQPFAVQTEQAENEQLKQSEAPLTQSISQTKGVQNLNKFLQNLLSDSDDESDGESYLEKYRRGKRDQVASNKQEEVKQPVLQPPQTEEQDNSETALETIVAEEEKRDVIEQELQSINDYMKLSEQHNLKHSRSEQDQCIRARDNSATKSDHVIPSVNFATEQPNYTEMTSPSHLQNLSPRNKILLSGATTGSPGPTELQSAIAGEFNSFQMEESKNQDGVQHLATFENIGQQNTTGAYYGVGDDDSSDQDQVVGSAQGLFASAAMPQNQDKYGGESTMLSYFAQEEQKQPIIKQKEAPIDSASSLFTSSQGQSALQDDIKSPLQDDFQKVNPDPAPPQEQEKAEVEQDNDINAKEVEENDEEFKFDKELEQSLTEFEQSQGFSLGSNKDEIKKSIADAAIQLGINYSTGDAFAKELLVSLIKQQLAELKAEDLGVVVEESDPDYAENKDCGDGSAYTGQLKNGKRHGKGFRVYSDGARYEGMWEEDQASGIGKLTHADGDVYNGYWLNDQKHGHGTYTSSDGAQFNGDWIADEKHGQGIETWQDGAKYQGSYKNGMKDGKGTLQQANGSEYKGSFFENEISGNGTYTWPDGREHTGAWERSQMHGQGVLKWSDGGIYKGEFQHNQREGFGSFTYPDGSIYEGQWLQGAKHGQGKQIFTDGTIQEGTWNEGDFIENQRHNSLAVEIELSNQAQPSSFHQEYNQDSVYKGFIDENDDRFEQLQGVEIEEVDSGLLRKNQKQASEEMKQEKQPSKQSENSYVVISQEDQQPEPEKKASVYDFLDQNDELEIEIEPKEFSLKFSNMDATVNTADFVQQQLQMNYFGSSPQEQKEKQRNMKVHFTFDKNSMAQFFLKTKDQFKTQPLTNTQIQDQSMLVKALQEKVVTGSNSIKLDVLADQLAIVTGDLSNQSKNDDSCLVWGLLSELLRTTLHLSGSRTTSLSLFDPLDQQSPHSSKLLHQISKLLLSQQPQSLKSYLEQIPLKEHHEHHHEQSQQEVSIGHVLFDHRSEIKFDQFTDGLVKRGHWADAFVFAQVFMPEEQRMQMMVQYMLQTNFTKQGNPLYTQLAIASGQQEELLWASSNVRKSLLLDWKMHAAFVLKNIDKLQVKNAASQVKAFFKRLATDLLTTTEINQDIYGHIICSILADSFDSDLIQEHSRMNLINVDLKLNYAMTILTKMQMLKSKQDQGRQIAKQTFLRKLVSLSFYRGVSFGQVLLIHEKALEEMHFVVEKRDYLPEKLKNSKNFELLLREMKQTSFENMRKQGEADTVPTPNLVVPQSSDLKIAHRYSEQLDSSHAESVQSSEDQKSKGQSLSIKSQQSSRRNSLSRQSNQPESALTGDEDQLDQGGMFGRFKGMFGRIKDEALTYVAPKDENDMHDPYGVQSEEGALKGENDEPEVTQKYFQSPPKAKSVNDEMQLELEESDIVTEMLQKEQSTKEESKVEIEGEERKATELAQVKEQVTKELLELAPEIHQEESQQQTKVQPIAPPPIFRPPSMVQVRPRPMTRGPPRPGVVRPRVGPPRQIRPTPQQPKQPPTRPECSELIQKPTPVSNPFASPFAQPPRPGPGKKPDARPAGTSKYASPF